MQGNKLFKVGSKIKSFYNETEYKIDSIQKSSPKNSDKYFIYMTCLRTGDKIFRCCSYKEFADDYYVSESGNMIKVGDKLKYKGHVNHDCFSMDFIYRFEHEEGLCDFYLKSESTGDVINFIGTEEDLLQKYELLKGSVEMKKDNKPFSEFKTNVQFTIDEQELLVINKDLVDIERQGNIDRLLEIGEFEKIRSYLAE